MAAEVSIGNAVKTDGFVIVEDVLSRLEANDLLLALEQIGDTGSVRKRGGIFAVRNLLDVLPEVAELAISDTLRALVEPVLGAHFFPVRGILFDKIPDANWRVPWHQDVTIAVQESRSGWLWAVVDEGRSAARSAAGVEPCVRPRHRRVVHLDFASVALPAGLQWLSEAS